MWLKHFWKRNCFTVCKKKKKKITKERRKWGPRSRHELANNFPKIHSSNILNAQCHKLLNCQDWASQLFEINQFTLWSEWSRCVWRVTIISNYKSRVIAFFTACCFFICRFDLTAQGQPCHRKAWNWREIKTRAWTEPVSVFVRKSADLKMF